MRNQATTKINLDVLQQAINVDYTDGDIIIMDDVKQLPVEGSLQMDMIVVLICTEGRLQVDINGQTFTAHAGDMLVCPPNVFIDNYMISPIFNAKIFGLSYNALQRMLHVNKDIWNMVLYTVKNPVYHLDSEQLELVSLYYALLAFKLRHGEEMYHREVMHALFQAVLYDLCSLLIPLIEMKGKQEESHMKQSDLLLKRFLQLLADTQGKERSVAFFARKLCITPKYLTTICKASSGKTALEWIHEYTMEVIMQQLKYTDRTIKEISNELDFPNISFFGKFVKGRLGISPTEYRKQLAKKKE